MIGDSKKVLAEIASSCEGLREIAKRHELATLAYIFDLAITEARSTTEPVKPTATGKVVNLPTKRKDR